MRLLSKSFLKLRKVRLLSLVFLLLCTSCLSYYQRNRKLMDAVAEGNIPEAEKLLDKDTKWEKRKRNALLYYLNKGTVLWMLNKATESNKYFHKADLFIEDYRKNYAKKALTLITNPRLETYQGEDFEKVLIHYYTTLNYLQLNNYEAALVEGRRMLLQLNRLEDKYKGNNKYKRDAFAHNLIGIIHEAAGDPNNAFIAYRNAYDIYKEDYTRFFKVDPPLQLKKDLLRTASRIGFRDEVRKYEKEFGFSYDPTEEASAGQLVFFWNNGLGPVKDQWSINFVIVPGEAGWVNFVNEDFGYSFPFYLGDGDDNEEEANELTDLKLVRVAFPKYVQRHPLYEQATLHHNGQEYTLETAQDINAIAFKSLNDRMLKEFGQSLLRVATKKLAEYKARKEDEAAGAAVGLLNAITEQADTRNWQTLPHTIYYSRVPLPKGSQEVTLKASSSSLGMSNDLQTFTFEVKPGRTYFQAFQTPQIAAIGNNIAQ